MALQPACAAVFHHGSNSRGANFAVSKDKDRESRVPSNEDIWQAASLLIGVYGNEAADYANSRGRALRRTGDLTAAGTWDLIASQIERLLRTAPAARLH